MLLSVVTLVALGVGCGNKGGDEKAEAEKKAFEAAAGALVEPVGLISAYQPHLIPPDETKDKWAPKRHNDLDRAMTAAANEIRHAANGASQVVERQGGAGTKDLEAALKAVAVACAEAVEAEAVAKCNASVSALDAALVKADAARTAAGATAKIPHIGSESITEQAKKAISGFLKSKGPSATEAAYIAKRSDPNANMADLISACQAAASEAEGTQKAMERAEEPIRLVAVTHKMSLDSQCNRLSQAEGLRKEIGDCKKKSKSSECKITCGKAKGMIDDGLPAAALDPMGKEYAAVCEKP